MPRASHNAAVTAQRGYARNGRAHLAYAVEGDGPVDLLHLSNETVGLDSLDAEPHAAQYLRRLASFSRLARFDQRGIGRSDPIDASQPWTVDAMAEDAVAVADHLGLEQFVLMGSSGAGPIAITVAARWPERVSALVLVNECAYVVGGADNPYGHPNELIESFLDQNPDPDSTWSIDNTDDIGVFAPSFRHDAAFRAWWLEAGQRGASPEMARIVVATPTRTDVRDLLDDVRAPALVIHRRDDVVTPVRLGRLVADRLADARFVELAGADHFAWAGDTNAVLDEVEDFLTGRRGGGERVLASVMFTDIVDSTVRAAALGDRAWRAVLDAHDAMVRAELARYGGREVNTTGDGFVGTFESPTQAARCARAVVDGASLQGVDVRAGVHVGEVERRGSDIAGLAVHLAARIAGAAAAGEVLVSRTLRDLVAGSDLHFAARGDFELKGVPEPQQLYALED